jgi:hypothetical protein
MELTEREILQLKVTYWTWVIAFQDCIQDGIRVDEQTIDNFLNWINANEEAIEKYGIGKM